VIDARKKNFEELNRLVHERHGWLVSVPGDFEMRLQVLPGSPLPAQLAALGYVIERTGTTSRILPHAVTIKFEVSSSARSSPQVRAARSR
jgi:hypothetical protein